jgi:N-acyl-D-aspartate/D-glutamate deacylase
MHDLVIRNGIIIDGSGQPRFAGDLAIDGAVIGLHPNLPAFMSRVG